MRHPNHLQDVFVKEEYHFLNVPGIGTFTVSTTPLPAPLNASAIRHVCPLTWSPPKEPMENFGANC